MKFNLNTQNINYIKIIYKDKEDFSHCIKATIKNLSDREIYALVKLEQNIIIRTPQEVELNIATNSGIYKSVTTLKYTQYEEPCLFLALKTPENMEYFQNREYFRVKLSENASISFQSENGTEVVSCVTDDISANGVKCIINTNTIFPENVEITLYFQNKNIKTHAKYIRTEKENEVYKASFSFVDLKENDLDFISQICIQKQLEAKRKTLM